MHKFFTGLMLASLVVCATAFASRTPRESGPEARTAPASAKDSATRRWFATLDRGLAAAKHTGKPILLVPGAPRCADVSGMCCPAKVFSAIAADDVDRKLGTAMRAGRRRSRGRTAPPSRGAP